jgi:hypothetical protein
VARLLADENVPWPVAEPLGRLGHDVLTVADRGQDGHSFARSRRGTLNRQHCIRHSAS